MPLHHPFPFSPTSSLSHSPTSTMAFALASSVVARPSVAVSTRPAARRSAVVVRASSEPEKPVETPAAPAAQPAVVRPHNPTKSAATSAPGFGGEQLTTQTAWGACADAGKRFLWCLAGACVVDASAPAPSACTPPRLKPPTHQCTTLHHTPPPNRCLRGAFVAHRQGWAASANPQPRNTFN
jgi:hypothetical protein